VTRWERIRKQNHWLDSTYNACVAGHGVGIRLVEEAPKPASPRDPMPRIDAGDYLRGRPKWIDRGRPGGQGGEGGDRTKSVGSDFTHCCRKIAGLTGVRNLRRHPPSSEKQVYDGTGQHHLKGTYIMGDRSPKAVQKKASQKQGKNDRADQQKKTAVAAKQAPAKK